MSDGEDFKFHSDWRHDIDRVEIRMRMTEDLETFAEYEVFDADGNELDLEKIQRPKLFVV